MSSPTRKKAPAGDPSFRSRHSKRFSDGNALAPKKSFQNLRQLFKLPARVLTPFSSKDEERGRAPMVSQTEPKTHRLMGEISPTRARALPSNSNTAPDIRTLAPRNASAAVHSSPLRNISEPLPLPRFPQPDSSRPTPSSLRSSRTKSQCTPPSRYTSKYSTTSKAEFEARSLSSARRAFTDITRRINSPILPRLSIGPWETSTPFLAVPYTSTPTTSECPQASPPRPVFTNGHRPLHRAERSLSVLNQENRRITLNAGRPRSITTRDSLATKHSFSKSVSSLIQASETTTASTAPATPPQALLTTNPRCVYTAQPHAYWAGRFMALHDQYHTQMFEATVNDDTLVRYFMNPLKDDAKLLQKEVTSTSGTNYFVSYSPTPASEAAIKQDEIRRCKRVFYTLQSLCVTKEAKDSLWGFQLRFARERNYEACLPHGGTMDRDKGLRSWTRLANRKRSNTVDNGGLGETF